jgi:hypothetical protein
MGLKAHQMDVESLRPQQGVETGSEGLHQRRGGRSTRGSLADRYPGGLFPFHQDVGLGRPMTSPRTPTLWHHLALMEVLGGSYVPSGTCGRFRRPKEA